MDDFVKKRNREKGIDKYDVQELEKDFSLKNDDKIEIKIKGITDKKDKPKSKLGGLKLAPPRGAKKSDKPLNTPPKEEENFEESSPLDAIFQNEAAEKQKEDDADGLLDF